MAGLSSPHTSITFVAEDAADPPLYVGTWWATTVTFGWVTPLMVRGRKRQLAADDLFELPHDMHPYPAARHFSAAFQQAGNYHPSQMLKYLAVSLTSLACMPVDRSFQSFYPAFVTQSCLQLEMIRISNGRRRM